MAFHQQQQDEDPDYRQVLHPSGRIVLVPIEKVIHSQQLYVHDAKTTCRYASKRCSNPRTTKRNGELHSFCEWHRTKANQNQRRLESKKKLQRVGIGGGDDNDTATSSSSTASSPSPMELSISSSNVLQDFESSSKLGSPHISHHSYDDDEGDDDSEEDPAARYSPSPFEPIGMHDPQVWATSNQYYYLPQQHQQQHQHSQPMDHLDNHSVTSSYNTGYQPSPPPHARAAYPQFQPLGNPLLEWELTGDLVGSSVAFAQTLNL